MPPVGNGGGQGTIQERRRWLRREGGSDVGGTTTRPQPGNRRGDAPAVGARGRDRGTVRAADLARHGATGAVAGGRRWVGDGRSVWIGVDPAEWNSARGASSESAASRAGRPTEADRRGEDRGAPSEAASPCGPDPPTTGSRLSPAFRGTAACCSAGDPEVGKEGQRPETGRATAG